jgi:hypothetical protein
MRYHDAGHALPASLRATLERGLSADLGAVRVHHGPVSDRLARGLGADAFTCGAHVYFRHGAYRPDTRDGLRLLAHELAHVVQQAGEPRGQEPSVVGRVRGGRSDEPGGVRHPAGLTRTVSQPAGMSLPSTDATSTHASSLTPPLTELLRH